MSPGKSTWNWKWVLHLGLDSHWVLSKLRTWAPQHNYFAKINRVRPERVTGEILPAWLGRILENLDWFDIFHCANPRWLLFLRSVCFSYHIVFIQKQFFETCVLFLCRSSSTFPLSPESASSRFIMKCKFEFVRLTIQNCLFTKIERKNGFIFSIEITKEMAKI